jgi:hypothetical protein
MLMLDTAVLNVIATISGSLVIALGIDLVRARRERRRLISALYDELRFNTERAEKALPGYETIFDLPILYTSAYENARMIGLFTGFPVPLAQRLGQLYSLIESQNEQTRTIKSEMIPRNRGYKERFQQIVSELRYLSREMEKQYGFLRN